MVQAKAVSLRVVSASMLAVLLAGASAPVSSPSTNQDRVLEMLSSEGPRVEIARTLLDAPDVPARLREVAAYVVGKFGGEEDNERLLRLADDDSHQVRLAALVAFQKILNPGNRHVDLLIRDRELLFPPAELPPFNPAWPQVICSLLRDESHLVRLAAAQTLGILRSTECLAELREVARSDRMEPARYFASKALLLITNVEENYVDSAFLDLEPTPLVTATLEQGHEAAELGAFVRASWFNPQAKFSIRGGMPAHRQTIANLSWDREALVLQVFCHDPHPEARRNVDGGDRLTLYLQPGKGAEVHEFEAYEGDLRLGWRVFRHQAWKEPSSSGIPSITSRTPAGWEARMRIPFRALGRKPPSVTEEWHFNLVRREVHQNGGGRTEVSSWTHLHLDEPGPPRLGTLRFAEKGPRLTLRLRPRRVHVFPFDDYSPAVFRNRPIDPAAETTWGRIAPPEHLERGNNSLNFRLHSSNPPLDSLILRIAAYQGESLAASLQAELDSGEFDREFEFNLEIPERASLRTVDLEIELLDSQSGSPWLRAVLLQVPIVDPPKRIVPYSLTIEETKTALWNYGESAQPTWKVEDHGPMLVSESYPMCLIEGKDGRLFGGTYPGGRLFSFDPASGIVEDLGSPSPPHNHLHDLVAAPDGRIFGGLYRPEGRLFSYDPELRSSFDLGIPVSGGFSATCKVSAWSFERVYGSQGGHLFFLETQQSEIVDKGNFHFQAKRYIPTNILSDVDGNLLGVAGGRFFRYEPENDEIRISIHGFAPEGNPAHEGGWILTGPEGRLYALFADGRLFRWEADQDRLVLVARYSAIEPGPGLSFVIMPTFELIVGRSGILNAADNVLLVYQPGGNPPMELGNPIADHLYLTAMTLASDDIVYGVSTHRAYSLERTPIHVYSITRSLSEERTASSSSE